MRGSYSGMSGLHIGRAVLALVWLTVLPSFAGAQYFGQNKVQYKDLDFKILSTEHFDIFFYEEERAGVEIAARMAERWYARLSRLLNHQLNGRQPLVLYASPTDFQQTNVIAGTLGEGTGGVTEPLRRRIVMPFGGPLADTDHVLGHEMVHAFQFDITTPQGGQGRSGIDTLPLWFIEGMAEYLSIGPVDSNTAMWVRDAARQDRLPEIDDLNDSQYFPYRWGHAFWAYVAGRWGDEVISRMLVYGAAAGSVDEAITQILGMSTEELSAAWIAAIRETYAPVNAATMPAIEAGGRRVIQASGTADLNIGPAISPDGRRIAFLSSRGLFSVDLYLADAETGRVIRKLTSTATSAHLSSIEFIESAGAWDKESRRLAIAVVANGRPGLAIFEAESGRKVREIPVAGVDQITNPAWSPDGQSIVFAGLSQGLTDLYVYNVNGSSLDRLTNDPFADVQPAWSPDGRRIAFATDRFTSSLETLSFGRYRLGVIDVASRRIEPMPTFEQGDSLNPQWSGDSTALFFVSDRTGIPNLYRATLSNGADQQLTNVATGLSGITASSPSMSFATNANVAAFSVYDNGRYEIYTLPIARGGQLRPVLATAATLPPVDRRTSRVVAMLNDAEQGLPDVTQEPKEEDYRSGLKLAAVGQPMVSMGVDRFGPTLGGAMSFYFEDLLGNQRLATAVQVNSGFGGGTSLRDTAAQLSYLNQEHRWRWGVAGGRVPYLSGGFGSFIDSTPAGEPIQVDEFSIFRQTEQSGSLMTAYPLSRAQRIEFQGGGTRLSFDRTTERVERSLATGQVLEHTRETASLGAPISLATASAALVYDTTIFGATSPVQGQRYRFEATPTFGTLNITTVLADYRRYMMPASFYTIAARVLHTGRYGADADDTRLFPIYLGYPTLVRGYDVNTFTGDDCIATGTSQCPVIDRLLGSRSLIANLELRFPLLRPFGVSGNMYGPVPMEVAVFADGGVAWNKGRAPRYLRWQPAGGGLGGDRVAHQPAWIRGR